jgi:hypothetical protein
MRPEGQGSIIESGASADAPSRSAAPAVYVPRRFRVGGIEGVPTGSAIVGTPQGDGMVAIEVESESGVEPTPEAWSEWVAAAADRHSEAQRPEGWRTVSEAALVEVGQFVNGHVSIADAGAGAAISRWIQTGRADYVVEAPFPHEP